MNHVLSDDAQAARRRECARIWLRQLAQLLYRFGFGEAYSRLDKEGAMICMRDPEGNELRLRTTCGGIRWQAHVARHHIPNNRLQTGGNLVATSAAVLEDAQKLVYERCIKPLR